MPRFLRGLLITSLTLVLGSADIASVLAATKSTATKSTPTKSASKRASTAPKSTSAKTSSSTKSTSSKSKTTAKKATTRTHARTHHSRPVVVPFDPNRPNTLRAAAAVVLDRRTGSVVWGKNADATRPVASLTKMMTALVLSDIGVAWADSITVTKDDVLGAGKSHVRAGNRVSIDDLFHCSLVSSDNAATRALARGTGLSSEEFVRRMNERASTMGLTHTHYADPTGLDPANTSTALDQAKVLEAAYANPFYASLMSLESYSFRCSKRMETLTNTNRLLHARSDIAGGKTGFTRPAGYCLATHVGDRSNPELTTVVLGAPSNSSRFSESAKLIDWAKNMLTPAASASEAVPSSHRR